MVDEYVVLVAEFDLVNSAGKLLARNGHFPKVVRESCAAPYFAGREWGEWVEVAPGLFADGVDFAVQTKDRRVGMSDFVKAEEEHFLEVLTF
jgi:hypothetical protein